MPEKVGEMRYEIYRLWIMVKLAWRIVQALKNAVDRSRISEVGEYALYVVDMNKKVAPKKFVSPNGYFFSILSSHHFSYSQLLLLLCKLSILVHYY